MNWQALKRSFWYYLAAFSVGLSVLSTAALIRKVLDERDDDHGHDTPTELIDPPTTALYNQTRDSATFNHFPVDKAMDHIQRTEVKT